MKEDKTTENNKVEDNDEKNLGKSEKIDSKEEKESKTKHKNRKDKKIKIKKKFKKRHIIILLIIAYIIFRIATRGNSIIPEIEQISKVERRDIATSISATGTVQSINTKDVSEASMTGMTVESVRVKEGDVINTGDIICTFNTDTLKSTLSQLKSSTSGLSGLSGLNSGNALNSGVSDIAKQSVEEAKKAYEQSNSSLETTKTQLKDAKKELDSYKPTYDAALKKFEPIKNAYAQKEDEYNSAVEDRNLADIDYNIAENEYYKYFHRSDPDKLRDEYTDGSGNLKPEYKTEVETAISNLNEADKARSAASVVENTKLKELENYRKNTYQPAYNEFSPIEQHYNQLKGNIDSLEAQKTALESSTASLKSTYQSLSAIASSANMSSMNGMDISSSLSGISGDMSSLNAQISQIQKQIDNAVIKSPVSGVVTAIGVKSGDTYTGSTIVRIENCQAFEIEAYIDEYDIPDVKKDMSVKIKTDATRDEVLNGKITYVAISSASISSGMDLSALTGGMNSYSGLSTSSSGKASYKVKIDINTPNDRLRAGMNAKLSIVTGEEKGILSVPYESIFERDDGTNYIKIVKPEYDVNANITKANEKYQKFTKKDINIEGSSTIKVLSDSLENNIEELDIKVGIEGTYYTQVISDQVSENTYVIVPKADSDNSLTQLFELMGADAGV